MTVSTVLLVAVVVLAIAVMLDAVRDFVFRKLRNRRKIQELEAFTVRLTDPEREMVRATRREEEYIGQLVDLKRDRDAEHDKLVEERAEDMARSSEELESELKADEVRSGRLYVLRRLRR